MEVELSIRESSNNVLLFHKTKEKDTNIPPEPNKLRPPKVQCKGLPTEKCSIVGHCQ